MSDEYDGMEEPDSVHSQLNGDAQPRESGGKDERKSAATVLVEQALADYTLGISLDGEPYALPNSGPTVVRMLRGSRGSLRAQLARQYFDAAGKAAPQQALADALLVLEGRAADVDPVPLHLRVAEHAGATYLDLGDPTGRAVEIGTAGWRIIDAPPVLFRRGLTAPLPEPEPGGSLDELWPLLNVTPDDRPLVLAWQLAALLPDVPHPILGLFGEQGTGKTTAAKALSLLLDPTSAPVRKAPRDADSWITAASGSWIVAIDNLSTLPDWLSDSLCRAVTGDGDVRRRLYSDGDLYVFAFRRCLIVTGIDLGSVRGDFADRLLPIDLHLIGDAGRAEEADLWRDWTRAHPRILGALLDLAASVKAVLPSLRLATKPRMADFARVLAAVDDVLGTEGMKRYLAKAGMLAVDSLTGDPFIVALERIETFTGTSAELLEQMTPTGEHWRAPKGWPGDARAATQLLHRQAPVMRRAGWEVEKLPTGHDNAIHWQLARPEKACNRHSQRSRHSQPTLDNTRDRESASVASHKYTPSQDDGTGTGKPVCPGCGAPISPLAAALDGACARCKAIAS